jgi:hypothetical protein
MQLLKLIALATALTAVIAAAARADPGRNIEAVLRPAAAGPEKGFGLVEFRQPKDEQVVVHLGVWVRDLLPNHTYYLQRATDVQDGTCSGTNWAMPPSLGAIMTDDGGTGRAELSRDLTMFFGSELDIRFRVVEEQTATAVPILESGCYQFTVSQ